MPVLVPPHVLMVSFKSLLNTAEVIGPRRLLCGYHANPVPSNAVGVLVVSSGFADCCHVPHYMFNARIDFHMFSMI